VIKPSARDGLKVRLMGQTGAAPPVWKAVAERLPNGPFIWRSSAWQTRFFLFFIFSAEFGTERLIVKNAECVNRHPDSVYLSGTIRSVLGQQRQAF
jgi:hypothetical protein